MSPATTLAVFPSGPPQPKQGVAAIIAAARNANILFMAPDSMPPGSYAQGVSDARRPVLVLGILCAVLGLALAGAGIFVLVRGGSAEPHARPSNTLLLATRDMSRLETTELHVEKVIDLTDTQSRLYGLVEGSDNVLLVAVGDVTLGVDLGKLEDGDVTMDEKTHAAHFRL